MSKVREETKEETMFQRATMGDEGAADRDDRDRDLYLIVGFSVRFPSVKKIERFSKKVSEKNLDFFANFFLGRWSW